MKTWMKATAILLVLLSILVLFWAIGSSHQDNHGRDSTDPEVKMIYAVKDGMETKYSGRSPIVTCKEYITCNSQSQYDYIMNGKISLLNDYGSYIIYDYSAYIVENSGSYSVVDSVIYGG